MRNLPAEVAPDRIPVLRTPPSARRLAICFTRPAAARNTNSQTASSARTPLIRGTDTEALCPPLGPGGDWYRIRTVYPIIKAMNPLVFEGRKSATSPPAGRHPGNARVTTVAEGKWVWPTDAANHPDGPHPNEIENSKEQKDSGSVKLFWAPKPGGAPLLYERSLRRKDGIFVQLPASHSSRGEAL